MRGDRARFRIAVSDAVIDRIRARLTDGDLFYAPEDDTGWRYGTDLAYLRSFVSYWRDTYDWRAAEQELNRYDQFVCRVDGIDIHFQYLCRSSGKSRRTLLLTHGWPGSTYEFHQAAALLSADFDLVIPSLPGYGFSARPARPIGPRQVARLWRSLMVDHLGVDRFGVQGGDWGSVVSSWLANDAPDNVAGLHLNLCAPLQEGASDPAEIEWRAQVSRVMQAESAYMMQHRTKPQTIGLALTDNPVGHAAWVLEKFYNWGDTKGDIESRFSKDWLITNLMIHLVNNAVSSMIWMYRGSAEESLSAANRGLRVKVPTAFAKFPGEFIPPAPRAVAERYFDIVRWTEMRSGGHFAALEEPAAFASDVGAFFDTIGL